MNNTHLSAAFFTLFAAGVSTSSIAAIVADQESLGGISGGYGGPVVQTFTPSQDNIAGVDAQLHGTGALTADVTLNLWGDLRSGDPVRSLTLNNVPRNTLMEFRWAATGITPGITYYLEFIISDALTMGSVIPGQYAGGAVIEGGGNLFGGAADLFFTTYSDDAFISNVPIPAAVWLFSSGLLGLVGVARRKKAA